MQWPTLVVVIGCLSDRRGGSVLVMDLIQVQVTGFRSNRRLLCQLRDSPDRKSPQYAKQHTRENLMKTLVCWGVISEISGTCLFTPDMFIYAPLRECGICGKFHVLIYSQTTAQQSGGMQPRKWLPVDHPFHDQIQLLNVAQTT
jgi:hypothetical protein